MLVPSFQEGLGHSFKKGLLLVFFLWNKLVSQQLEIILTSKIANQFVVLRNRHAAGFF